MKGLIPAAFWRCRRLSFTPCMLCRGCKIYPAGLVYFKPGRNTIYGYRCYMDIPSGKICLGA